MHPDGVVTSRSDRWIDESGWSGPTHPSDACYGTLVS